ncbi:ATPase, T2SS/T4P/T4SS family [Caminibacter pacificus]
MSKFADARELFRDVVDLRNYIPLNTSEKTKQDLINAINQQEKMILLTGAAGSGKSLILRTVYEELKKEKDVFFISNPYLEIDSVLELIKTLGLETHHILLLDEAQLLTPETWENLRIYADKGNITIVFATHDTDVNKLLQKKHFKTRINYIIPVKNVSFSEMENFIYSKLLKNNFNDIAEMLTKKNFKKIYKYTRGSLRATNQLMFKLFDVVDYFYEKEPSRFSKNKIDNKYIEIAIMDLKAIDA